MTRILLFAAAFFVAGLVSAAVADARGQSQMVPIASGAERVLAALAVSVDGRELTIRGAAPDDLKVCVEPKDNNFGRRICYAVRDLRRGLK